MDNLSTHSPASFYNALPASEARRILRRLEFHFTPKHASWLNMVEIAIGVLRGQYLKRAETSSKPKSPPGNSDETKVPPTSTGCSQSSRRNENANAPIQNIVRNSKRSTRKHNLCAELLGPVYIQH